MPSLKAGERLRSSVCNTEVMVIAAPDADVELCCGGASMVDLESQPEPGASLDPDAKGGTQIGKRYVNEAADLELPSSDGSSRVLGSAGGLGRHPAEDLVDEPPREGPVRVDALAREREPCGALSPDAARHTDRAPGTRHEPHAELGQLEGRVVARHDPRREGGQLDPRTHTGTVYQGACAFGAHGQQACGVAGRTDGMGGRGIG